MPILLFIYTYSFLGKKASQNAMWKKDLKVSNKTAYEKNGKGKGTRTRKKIEIDSSKQNQKQKSCLIPSND